MSKPLEKEDVVSNNMNISWVETMVIRSAVAWLIEEIKKFNGVYMERDKKYAVEGVEESRYYTKTWITREHVMEKIGEAFRGLIDDGGNG